MELLLIILRALLKALTMEQGRKYTKQHQLSHLAQTNLEAQHCPHHCPSTAPSTYILDNASQEPQTKQRHQSPQPSQRG